MESNGNVKLHHLLTKCGMMCNVQCVQSQQNVKYIPFRCKCVNVVDCHPSDNYID